MKLEVVAAIITGELLLAIMNDPYFTHVPVSHEGNGIAICAGAWLG